MRPLLRLVPVWVTPHRRLRTRLMYNGAKTGTPALLLGIKDRVELVKSALRLDFVNAQKPWSEMRDIIRVVSGDQNAQVQAAPIVVDREKDHTRITIQVRALSLELEQRSTSKNATEAIVKILSDLHQSSELPDISKVLYEQTLIEPIDLTFHELVSALKRIYLQQSRIVDQASDIGLSLDRLMPDGVLQHIQIGPMDAQQLTTQWLRWKRESTPDTFVYIRVASELAKEDPFRLLSVQSFLEASATWQIAEADAVAEQIREGIG